MIQPLPLPECSVYLHAISEMNIAATLDGGPRDAPPGHTGLALAAADSALLEPNRFRHARPVVANSRNRFESAPEARSFALAPEPGRGGTRHWLSIMASAYGIGSILSLVVLVLLLRYDERRFNTGA